MWEQASCGRIPCWGRSPDLRQNEYVTMTSVVVVWVSTSGIYLLTYFGKIKNFRGAGEDLKVFYTPCEECRTPLIYNLTVNRVQIPLDPEISVGNMPLEVALLVLLQDWKFHLPSHSVWHALPSDLLKLLSFCVRVYSYWYLAYWSHSLLHTIQ